MALWLIYLPYTRKAPRISGKTIGLFHLTSVLSKILEHIVSSGISNFLESNNILTPHQHGFRRGHSCTTQLINADDDWAKAINDGYRTDVAFLTLVRPLIQYHTSGCFTNCSITVSVDLFCAGYLPFYLVANKQLS